MTDPALVWRDDQIAMLKQEILDLRARVADLEALEEVAAHRAERAEEALRNLKEEIADARRPAVG